MRHATRRSEIRIKNLSAATEVDLSLFDHKMIQASHRLPRARSPCVCARCLWLVWVCTIAHPFCFAFDGKRAYLCAGDVRA